MFGYIDESGTPGKAQNGNDWFLVALVVFKTKRAKEFAADRIASLRNILVLPDDYEFHRINDPKYIRVAFEKNLRDLDFEITYVYYKKSQISCRFRNLAERLVLEMANYPKGLSVLMDKNASLYRNMRKYVKQHPELRRYISEGESYKYEHLQIADYLVNMKAKELKSNKKVLPKELREKIVCDINLSQ